ncbi:aminotransferase class V-fold PLP-dependent enzyme [Methanosarcina sp. KYL-1]|uniref:aminotransferase class V-fold PLP-dependent enzyme n=1 Tax=Methanosarcina sp. KYL-1 TaxID=2602068 RepID=UPI0021010B03|nr:aminotransferase class V-fold PLP-dependent enzyme [Methanosarcina sp. KYL-1]MCQ1535238.1 aminotransferase class V-fold PLP-dependent enzyme [Methanosarcina sp. KYL-1]
MISISQAPIYPQEILKTAFTYLTNNSTGCATFRDEISNYLNCRYVNLTSSGFSGLYTILKACDLKKGDEVIIPAYTCEDIPRLVNEMGFKLKFVDIEPYTYNIDPDNLRDKISSNTKVVIAAHMFGYPCSIDEITEISHEHGAFVIEDACQSFGAEFKGKKVGTFGDAGLFSLNMGKPITTIHGGIVCTNNREVSYKISAINDTFKKYGIIHQTKTFAYMIGYSLCNVNFFYSSVYRIMGNKNLGETRSTTYSEVQGLTYKYTEFQATLGLQQLSKLDVYNNARIKNASYLMNNLDRNGLLFPEVPEHMKPTFSRFPIYFENIDREDRKNLINAFVRSGIEVTPYITSSLPQLFNEKSPDYTIAEKMANKTLTIPTHPNINKRNLDKIIDLLNHWPHL